MTTTCATGGRTLSGSREPQQHFEPEIGKERRSPNHTGGMIGSLSHAVRGAALDAILTGTEKITRKSLQAIPLDHTAHTTAPTATKTATSR
ncbi:hypothetical protein F558DRAFT_03587 [Streptomyces sp. AmelKG-A3]|nr:hypothetical protein [Streptomyces sp. SID4941]SCE34884.1 hypothetical protein GA0115247_132646 [Streptomyces sp. PalvLS-984]SDD20162.1 hypothetical protein F558DRAFT_03587 [Streptomyces sp. AmelKG-A3]